MSDSSKKFSVEEEDIGLRLDVILAKKISSLTRSNLKKIIELRQVRINNFIEVSPAKKLKNNDVIEIDLLPRSEVKILPTKIKLDIVYEDKDILIINKPAGMVVHPGAGNYKKTLVNALIYKYKKNLSNINGVTRPGIVHRIDKETSGLLVIAKNNKAHSNLGKQFSNHTIQRTYQALAWGVLRPLNGKIETLIGRSKKNRQLMSVTEISGKNSITNYKTLKVFNIKDIPKISFIECKLETGRTHQIRVHMTHMGNSIMGDGKYKKKYKKLKNIDTNLENLIYKLDRQFLHAHTLGFIHPKTNNEMTFTSILPQELENILLLLRNTSK